MYMSSEGDTQSPQLENIPKEDLPTGEEVLKQEEGISPIKVQVPGSLALDGPQFLFRTLLDGCQDYF